MEQRPSGGQINDQDALRERRIQTVKGELVQFLNAVLGTTDSKVRRTWRGFVASLHGATFEDEQR